MKPLKVNIEDYDKLISLAYQKYCDNFIGYDDIPSIGWFILECERNDNFSKKFGCKIERVKLTDEERYNIWFTNNYETGMERFFIPDNLPNFDDDYYEPTPTEKIILTINDVSYEKERS
jgi:hypothetical protein